MAGGSGVGCSVGVSVCVGTGEGIGVSVGGRAVVTDCVCEPLQPAIIKITNNRGKICRIIFILIIAIYSSVH